MKIVPRHVDGESNCVFAMIETCLSVGSQQEGLCNSILT